ncbi:YdiK family protein [Bacillus tianshenii]|nr:YdiK family protein [Bacillus tianshenii]
MRVTPIRMSVIYGFMGFLFTSLAIQSAQETVWNTWTIILMLIAAYDFFIAVRFLKLQKRLKKKK